MELLALQSLIGEKMSNIKFTKGTNKKPASSSLLEQTLSKNNVIDGQCYFGFPLIATPDGKYSLDATLISKEIGIVIFDLIEGTNLGDYKERQDDLGNKLESKLKVHRDLVKGRKLIPEIRVVTFAPSVPILPNDEDYYVCNDDNLLATLQNFGTSKLTDEIYSRTLSAIESLSTIRKSRQRREVYKPDSKGAKLKNLEDSIATLDHKQNKAVIETIEGVQRIRGLAGSGKTIILALKAAYLHIQHPEWRIAVTFHTRALKAQFKKLINHFCIEQSGDEPDWNKIRIINSWGAPGGDERDGIYYEFCRLTDQKYFDLQGAKAYFGNNDPFASICSAALKNTDLSPEVYDAILVDEAQDFSSAFLQLCFRLLKDPRRLVYAYDELQSLSGASLPPPEEIFGKKANGEPVVSLAGDTNRDVLLEKCYRNSLPVLVSAHALGFGIYRDAPSTLKSGLVQMFEQPALWKEIGYQVKSGVLAKGERVVLERTNESSPDFLANHSSIDDLIIFKSFKSEAEQNEWLTEEIIKNIREDELRYDDIVVINPDPFTAREKLGQIRRKLFDNGIPSHTAGVDTDADVFFKNDSDSITCTGIYRAKGNEAGMVYVVNAQDCDGEGIGLSSLRNRLFTAMTRSKAWIRVIGWGDKMDNLIKEYEILKSKEFKLDFTYPDENLLKTLRVVHKDLSPHEKQRLQEQEDNLKSLTTALESGELNVKLLDNDVKQRLLKLLSDGGSE